MKIDIETYSGYDIKITGLHKYVEHPDFKILLVSWSDESGELHTWDCAAGLPLPRNLVRDLMNPKLIKYAYNAKFEIACLQKYLPNMPVTCWRDDMFTALYSGLPASLGGAGKALGLPADKSKDLRGKALIRRFCGPAKPKPYEGSEWDEFKEYNRQDVTAEAAIVSNLPEPPEHEQRAWLMDMFINARGVKVDMQLVNNAIRLLDANTAALMAEARELSGIENPNSVAQLMGWFKRKGLDIKGLTKEIVSQQLAGPLPATVRRMFEIRQSLGRTGVKKYMSIRDSVCADGRIRGLFQIYGAPRTGRFAGRRVQLQNLKRNTIDNLDEVRQAVKAGYVPDGLDITDTLGQLIRTTLIPEQGKRFIVADYSAIEARVIAWIANEKWRLTSFAEGKDIYCESASAMFGVPVAKHGLNGHLRQKGKIAELACIAEGQLVLTNHGLKPIERVSLNDRLWDGISWIKHDGVVYRGFKEVIEYEGLKATKDHIVFTGDRADKQIQFGHAAASGLHITKTGDYGQPIRLGANHIARSQTPEAFVCFMSLRRLWSRIVDYIIKFAKRQIKGLPALQPAATYSEMVGQTFDCSKTALRESERQGLHELWSKGYQVCFQFGAGSGALYDTLFGATDTRNGNRQNKQQRRLCCGQFTLGDAQGKPIKQASYYLIGVCARVLALFVSGCYTQAFQRTYERTDYRRREKGSDRKAQKLAGNTETARVYDIRNAGPHNRYTVSGKLVHNCGYGGGLGAMKAMGADKAGLTDAEITDIVTRWRDRSPHIVALWSTLERAAFHAIQHKGHKHGIQKCWFIFRDDGCLYMHLPSNREICYRKAHICKNRWGQPSIGYWGWQNNWVHLETYGGKLTENLVQAVSRDLLVNAMLRLDERYNIVMHVHDEVIIEHDNDALEDVIEVMTQGEDWTAGLPLDADGFVCDYYRKD